MLHSYSFDKIRTTPQTMMHTFLISYTGGALDCDKGWVARPGSTTCYKFIINQKSSWNDALKFCQGLGAHLATLELEAEVIWAKGYRGHYPILRKENNNMFIGGFKKDGVWFWREKSSDSPILIRRLGSWTAWWYCRRDQCLVMFSHTSHSNAQREWFRFNDDHCSSKMAFICEKSMAKKPRTTSLMERDNAT